MDALKFIINSGTGIEKVMNVFGNVSFYSTAILVPVPSWKP